MRVTVFAPHPDDELIGCGGSLLKWIGAGAEVSVVYLTSGDAAMPGFSRAEIATLREQEAAAGMKHVNVGELDFLREPDGALVESPALVSRLVHQIRLRRPDLACIPHALDDHPDHMATHRLLKRAIHDAGGPWSHATEDPPWRVDVTLAYEVWSPIQRPNYLEDTTDVIEEQLRALAHYRSQLEQVPYDSFVRGLASYRGAPLGHGRYAEAFEVLSIHTLPWFSA
jgi:N-acetylglucosamine malate deacetylase 1